jgi:hypothetical protein
VNEKEIYEKLVLQALDECNKNQCLYGIHCLDEQIPEILKIMNFQPKRSKREDFAKCTCKIMDIALDRAVSEGAWDQEKYDAMFKSVQEAKMRCSEHCGNTVSPVQ